MGKNQKKMQFAGPVVTKADIRRYRCVPTVRKLQWLEEMRRLVFAIMTPALQRRMDALRRKGF